MTNLRDYLTDMVKETIVRHNDFVTENKHATKDEAEEFVFDIVDEYLGLIVKRLIDY